MAGNPFDIWKDKTVRVFFTSDNGDQNLAGSPDPNKFTLRAFPFVATGASCTPFFVEFANGQLPAFWHLVMLVPRGDQDPPPPNTLLPPLEDLTEDDVTHKLRTLIAEVDTADTDIRRLEGFVPVASGNPLNLKFDEVRMVYLEKAMRDKVDPNKLHDYVYINFRTVMGTGPKPNGAGSGPPDG
jgi:hypothetical protein